MAQFFFNKQYVDVITKRKINPKTFRIEEKYSIKDPIFGIVDMYNIKTDIGIIYDLYIVKYILDKNGNRVPILRPRLHKCENITCINPCYCGKKGDHYLIDGKYSDEYKCGTIKKCLICNYISEDIDEHDLEYIQEEMVCIYCGYRKQAKKCKLKRKLDSKKLIDVVLYKLYNHRTYINDKILYRHDIYDGFHGGISLPYNVFIEILDNMTLEEQNAFICNIINHNHKRNKIKMDVITKHYEHITKEIERFEYLTNKEQYARYIVPLNEKIQKLSGTIRKYERLYRIWLEKELAYQLIENTIQNEKIRNYMITYITEKDREWVFGRYVDIPYDVKCIFDKENNRYLNLRQFININHSNRKLAKLCNTIRKVIDKIDSIDELNAQLNECIRIKEELKYTEIESYNIENQDIIKLKRKYYPLVDDYQFIAILKSYLNLL